MKKIFLNICFLFLLMLFSCGKEDNFENENFNDFIVGTWTIDSTSENAETIEFYEENFFILNDTLFGNYWVTEENVREIKYICDDEADVSIMKLVRYVGSNKSIIVNNLPKHEGDSHMIKKEK